VSENGSHFLSEPGEFLLANLFDCCFCNFIASLPELARFKTFFHKVPPIVHSKVLIAVFEVYPLFVELKIPQVR